MDSVKALAWPAFAFTLLVVFWAPLRETAELVPALLRDSEELSFGGFKFRGSKRLGEHATPAVRQAVTKMSSGTVEYVFDNEVAQLLTDSDPDPADRKIYRELVESGLCTEMSRDERRQEELIQKKERDGLRKVAFGLRCGDVYVETREFLRKLVPEVAKQVARAEVIKKGLPPESR